ncbi:MAG: NAD(P)-dependent oxidoreductase [Verrucomicrobia bacterium]|nr:NAD(P)-dependent oxidoreductase [Verrucomicrobiota bacterium]MBU6446094.1 NAD(P)-dependent oxidoreductase [Verrucomicrobiota bacterium]MDE3046721.1 NAD(P)-dependent oxidoreductase [Verrucomicrobiota bacterium]
MKDIVIVTGCCGRIGSQLIKRLAPEYSLIGFDLHRPDCKEGDEDRLHVDLSSDESVERAFEIIQKRYGKRIASVVHLAAYYSFKDKFSPLYNQVTVQGTNRLLRALQSFEVGQFLFSSTMLIHAPTRPGVPITEDSPICATWGYPISKVQTEQLIHEKHGSMPTVIMRIAGVYDDVCHSIPISNQIQRIYEKKLEARLFSGNVHHGAAFIHMDDLIDALALAVNKRKELPHELVLLIGESKTLSYDQLQRSIAKLLYHQEFTTFRVPKLIAKLGAWVQCHMPFGPEPFIHPWMIDYADDHYELNIDRAKKVLGWSPKRSIAMTLPKMIEALKKAPEEWYRANGLVWSHS